MFLTIFCVCLGAVLFTYIFKKLLKVFFKWGSARHDRYKRLTWRDPQKWFLGLAGVLFLVADLYGRLTIIVIDFEQPPKLELITSFINHVLCNPHRFQKWQVWRAIHYAKVLILPYHRHHFNHHVLQNISNKYGVTWGFKLDVKSGEAQ